MIMLFLPCDNHDYFGAGSLFNLPLVWETRKPHPLVNTCVVVVQSLSHVWLFVTPWTGACQASCPSLSPRVCPSSCPLNQWYHQTISSSGTFHLLPSIFSRSVSFPMSQLFTSGGQSIGVSALVLPMNYSGLISFRIDWFDLLPVQGILKRLLQHHNSKASILRPSAFYMLQLSHPYMITRKTIALMIWTFVSKVMSLLFNMLPMLLIAFLPRSKRLLTHMSGYWN